MAYGLGVDLGTTYTAAAVRLDGGVEMVQLGHRRPAIPSLVFVRSDGTVLIGEAAERRAAAEPARLAREFKRRVGDPVPLLVGGAPYSAHALMARLLGAVLQTVTAHYESPPASVTVTHPANWGPYKRELLEQAVRLAGLSDVGYRSEPEAAAIQYAAGQHIRPGEIVAVYDLGGGTFDAAVLRKTGTGFELLGEPEGIEQLGGIDFDEAIFGHVTAVLGDAVGRLDPEDEVATAAVGRLRRECQEAKEALSYDTEVMVPVALPGLHTQVRLNRSEFEAMIGPALADTVGAMRRALASARVTPGQLRSILLAGGSSRIPLVSQLLSTAFGRPVVLDPHPEHSIAVGAALAGPAPAAGPDAPAGPPPGVAGAPAAAAGTQQFVAAGAGTTAVGPDATTAWAEAGAAETGADETEPTAPALAGREPVAPGPAGREPVAAPGPVAATPASLGPGSPDPGPPDPGPPGIGSSAPARRARRGRVIAVAAAAVAVLLVAAAVAAVRWWPRGTPTGTGTGTGAASTATPGAGTSPAAGQPALLWTFKTPVPILSRPVVDGPLLYFGGQDGNVYALNRANGRVAWSYRTGAGVVAYPYVAAGVLYVASRDSYVYALGAKDGKLRWRTRTSGPIDSSPRIADGLLYIGSNDWSLYALTLAGKPRWHYRTRAPVTARPASNKKTVYAGSQDGHLYALDGATGRPLWQAAVGAVFAAPAVLDNSVFVGSNDGTMYALDDRTGRRKWTLRATGPITAGARAENGAVYFGDLGGQVYTVDSRTGDQRWRFTVPSGKAVQSTPAVVDDRVYVGSDDHRLYALDAATGARRWDYLTGGAVGSPRVDGGVLYVGCADGTMYALRLPGPAPSAGAGDGG